MNEPITREAVLSVVRKHIIATIDGVNEETIAKAKALSDIGASSLDVVEIISTSMRELRIKVPRAELMLVEDLDELVDLLYQRAVAASQASPPSPPPPAA